MINDSSIWANNRLRLIVASHCNIDCYYCHNEGQSKRIQLFPDALFLRVKELLAVTASRLASVTFSGGEPLLHPLLESFIEGVTPYSDKRTLVTNGLLLTQARLRALLCSGLTKIRLGVDSFNNVKSRPTLSTSPNLSIHDVIRLLIHEHVNFELNVVLTSFNSGELQDIIGFCKDYHISAKFFEHIQTQSFDSKGEGRRFAPKPLVAFEEFDAAVRSVLPGIRFQTSSDFGAANMLYECKGFSLRYCRYLCTFGLCYMTGTRIDPFGSVYACMEEAGEFRISPEESLMRSEMTIISAKEKGCSYPHRVCIER